MSHTTAVILTPAGTPSCLLRIWWIWWSSPCRGCGLEHGVDRRSRKRGERHHGLADGREIDRRDDARDNQLGAEGLGKVGGTVERALSALAAVVADDDPLHRVRGALEAARAAVRRRS